MFFDISSFSDNVALESVDGYCLTYGQIRNEAECILNAIGNQKICTLILADRSIGAVAMYYISLINGYVPLVLDERTNYEFIREIIKNYKFQYIMCSENKSHIFKNYSIIYKNYGFFVFSTGYPLYDINPDLALLISTSGSTGSPKTVRLTYKNLYTAVKASAAFYRAVETDVGMMILPMAYCFGQVFLLVHFYRGAKVCVSNHTIFEKEFWSFFNRSNITDFYFVPYTGSQLNRLGFFDYDTTSLRYISQGGGKADTRVSESFIKGPLSQHARFCNIYGQTEAVMISGLPYEYLEEKPESVGTGLPGINVFIKDNCDVGEIVVEGKNICLGYANTFKDLSLGDEYSGVLYTGDIGRIDDDGCLFLVGRDSRFSKIAGLRISHDEVEKILMKKYPSIDAACVGDDNAIMILLAGDVDVDNARKFLCRMLNLDKTFFKIIESSSLPLLHNGKIDYRFIKTQLFKEK